MSISRKGQPKCPVVSGRKRASIRLAGAIPVDRIARNFPPRARIRPRLQIGRRCRDE